MPAFMSFQSPYPSPPCSQIDHMDAHSARPALASAWHILEQPPPPTLREVLNAYKSRGDGDREMLLAMLNAKSAEDQRIAAIANLHQKLLDISIPPQLPTRVVPAFRQSNTLDSYQTPSSFDHSPTLPKTSPESPRDISLPSINVPSNPRKRVRTSRSPPPLKRRHSRQGSVHQSDAPAEQLPPSPPFSSPGRSTQHSEPASHPPPRDAMAIGSLLSSRNRSQEVDTDWPSRTSSERDKEAHR